MAEYSYSISLRVTHPTMDLDVVTDVLGQCPQVIWKVGQPRRTPKGTALPGVYERAFWTTRLLDGASTERDLSAALTAALELVAAGSALFGEIAATGGSTEIFVGWFFDEGNSGDVLDHRLLARLANMSINLSFDVYAEKTDGG